MQSQPALICNGLITGSPEGPAQACGSGGAWEPHGPIMNMFVKVSPQSSSAITSPGWEQPQQTFFFELRICSVGVKTRLTWKQLWYFPCFSQCTPYMYVFFSLDLFYQSDDPMRVHNGGVRLHISIPILNFICSMGTNWFAIMAGFTSL